MFTISCGKSDVDKRGCLLFLGEGFPLSSSLPRYIGLWTVFTYIGDTTDQGEPHGSSLCSLISWCPTATNIPSSGTWHYQVNQGQGYLNCPPDHFSWLFPPSRWRIQFNTMAPIANDVTVRLIFITHFQLGHLPISGAAPNDRISRRTHSGKCVVWKCAAGPSVS